MSVINTNITSLIGQQNLQRSQGSLQTSMERLSSGMRINSAKDDAAGQAIANRMSAQINGLAQAQRNANDGISVAQTAEGALNQVNDNLQRIRELSVQAQNDTNSGNDLQSIQDEIDQRLAEIDRISRETNFNGVNVLDTDDGLTIQVGANDGETITVNLQTINSDTLTLDGFSVVDGIDPEQVGSTAVTSATVDVNMALSTDGLTAPNAGSFGDFVVDGDGNVFVEVTGTSGGTNDGYYAVTLTASGNNIEVAGSLAASQPASGDVTVVTTADFETTVNLSGADAANVFEYVGGSGDPQYVIQVGSGADAEYFEAEIATDGTVIRGDQLAVGERTEDPLARLDDALNQVDSLRSELGAVQNRFEDAINNLSTNETNLAAARSRIEDADYAVEVANMTRAQILQQAGTSVLAQANQIPQNVLSLLG